ncbi:uncharacterized protein LOC142229764 [Haematobia irritans]|uniref:uncharacterized protein LOC142229764 n=1 Tax=Haematobia irritans TaxID=7368 RepID=UPI003F50A953
MASDQLLDLLKELKGEKFYQLFLDCQIDAMALKFMSDHHLDNIIPKNMYGPRIVFEYHLKEWQSRQNAEESNPMPTASVSLKRKRETMCKPSELREARPLKPATNPIEIMAETTLNLTNEDSQSRMLKRLLSLEDETDSAGSPFPMSIYQSETSPRPQESDDNDASLLQPLEDTQSAGDFEPPPSDIKVTIVDILKESFNGKQVLAYYEKNSILNPKLRVMLSGCVVEYLVEKNIRPKREIFSVIADNIVKFFKTENKDIYYVDPVYARKPGGILYSKYHNYWQKLRHNGVDIHGSAKKFKKIDVPQEDDDSQDSDAIVFSPSPKARYVLKMPLENILSRTCIGRHLFDCYEKQQKLTQKQALTIAACVSDHFVEYNITPRPEDFDGIADHIIRLFPNESKDTYFCRPEKGKKPGGVLYRKYHNRIFSLKKSGLYENGTPRYRKRARPASNATIEATDEQIADREWLKLHMKPLEDIYVKWQNTHTLRKTFIEVRRDLQEILTEWPLYRHSFGYHLIEIDFSLKYPEVTNGLRNKWEQFSNVIMCLLKDVADPKTVEILKEFYETEHDSEITNCVIFYGLHGIIKPNHVVAAYDPETNEKKFIKTSMQEARNAFMLICHSQEKLMNTIRDIKETSYMNEEIFPPIIGCVGSSLFAISEYYVFYDEICYELTDILSCVDVAMKVYKVLGIDFSKQCKSVWYFLQSYFYDLPIPDSEKSTHLTGLFNDLQVITV